jgi:hypothetical protein
MLNCHAENASNHCNLFSRDGKLIHFKHAEGLLQEMECTDNPEEWKHFVGSSQCFLKSVLLVIPLTSVAHLFKSLQQFAPFHHSAQYIFPGCKYLSL